MRFVKSLLMAVLMLGIFNTVYAADSVKLSGTRFTMDVPGNWAPGYKDVDNKLLMIYFSDAITHTTLEGVYLRKIQPKTFSLADFKKWRIGAEGKRYAGKDFKVIKEGELSIAGGNGNFLETSWKDGGKSYVKYTAQYLNNGGQYMVVLHGVKGNVDKNVFDHAVKSFALAKSK